MSHLEITTKDTRYIYPTGRIRGVEKHLLQDADFARVKEGEDLKDSFQRLSHIHPYSESIKVCTRPEDFEKGLEEEWRRTYLEIKSFAPEPELVDLFWLEQDFHNLKVLFKLRAQGKLPQQIDEVEDLSTSGTLSLDVLGSAVIKEDFLLLPPSLKETVKQVIDMMERGTSARSIDIFLDRMYWKKFSSEILKYKDNFLTQLANMLIDGLNIKNLLRVKLWNREDEGKLLEAGIIEGGRVGKDTIKTVQDQPLDSSLEVFRGTKYQGVIQKALEEWRQTRSLFSVDNLLEKTILDFTYEGFYTTFGRECLINYILLKKSEIKILRGILRAKKANFSHSQIKNIGL